MAESDRKRMILNRVEPDGADLGEATKRVSDSPNVRLLRANSPTSLLIEGAGDAIERLVLSLKGWNALPTVSYTVPDTRARVLKPPP